MSKYILLAMSSLFTGYAQASPPDMYTCEMLVMNYQVSVISVSGNKAVIYDTMQEEDEEWQTTTNYDVLVDSPDSLVLGRFKNHSGTDGPLPIYVALVLDKNSMKTRSVFVRPSEDENSGFGSQYGTCTQ
jgi:hypothetical protein